MATLTADLARTRPDSVALVDDDGVRTWAELDDRIDRLANGFRRAGLGAGDTLAIMTGNCREWFEVTLACAHIGVTFVPINWHLVADEVGYILTDSGAVAVVADHRTAPTMSEALDHTAGQIELVWLADAGREPGPDADAAQDPRWQSLEAMIESAPPGPPEDTSLGGPMFYTSGTTGRPKGVRSSLTGGEGVPVELLQLVAGSFDRFVPPAGVTALCGPIHHSAQWAFSWLPMISGSAVVMQHKYDSAALLDLIDRWSVTNVHLVPTQMKRLVDLPAEVRAGYDGSSLTAVVHGAAPCPPAVKRQLIEWWGPIVTEYYGSTEGSLMTAITAGQWLEKGGSVGPPLPNMEIYVVDDDGEQLGPGQDGTLYFRNALGTDFSYHNAPEKTAEAHREPGVFTTGDVGHLDDDGFLWLSDRRIDMIISGGVNIYPAEIEGVLGGHPGVDDVAVIGIPNDEFGEEVKAVVVAGPGLEPDGTGIAELAAHCRGHLAGYKVPRSFDFVDELPRTGTGKIRKAVLKEPYWADTDRSI